MRVVLALLLLPATAAADLLETPRPRQGYYVAGGLFGAVSYAREDGETSDALNGFAMGVRLGQLLTPRFGMGFYFDAGGAGGPNDESAALVSFGLGAQLELARNLALTGSVGLGIVSLSSPDDDPDEGARGVVGGAYSLGLAYDWFPSPCDSGGVAITPTVQLRAVPGDTDAFAAYLGVEVTWWTGLPRNQLDLDAKEAFQR
jgi:hypothetical protein